MYLYYASITYLYFFLESGHWFTFRPFVRHCRYLFLGLNIVEILKYYVYQGVELAQLHWEKYVRQFFKSCEEQFEVHHAWCNFLVKYIDLSALNLVLEYFDLS